MGEGENKEQDMVNIDKLGERMSQSINKMANNLRKLTMKYVSFTVSLDELRKEEEDIERGNSKAVDKFNNCKVEISESLSKYADELDTLCQLIDNDKHVKD